MRTVTNPVERVSSGTRPTGVKRLNSYQAATVVPYPFGVRAKICQATDKQGKSCLETESRLRDTRQRSLLQLAERTDSKPAKCVFESHESDHEMTYKTLSHQRKDQRKKRQLIQEFKKVPCADCGQSFPPYCMDFDHRDPSQKSFTIARVCAYGRAKLLAEIAKCDVVCAVCHRIRTHDRSVSSTDRIPDFESGDESSNLSWSTKTYGKSVRRNLGKIDCEPGNDSNRSGWAQIRTRQEASRVLLVCPLIL